MLSCSLSDATSAVRESFRLKSLNSRIYFLSTKYRASLSTRPAQNMPKKFWFCSNQTCINDLQTALSHIQLHVGLVPMSFIVDNIGSSVML